MYAIGRGMAWSSGGVAILEATGRALPMSAPHAGLRAPRCDRPPRPSERFARPVSIAFGHVAAAHPEAPPHRGTGVRTARTESRRMPDSPTRRRLVSRARAAPRTRAVTSGEASPDATGEASGYWQRAGLSTHPLGALPVVRFGRPLVLEPPASGSAELRRSQEAEGRVGRFVFLELFRFRLARLRRLMCVAIRVRLERGGTSRDRKSTRLNSSHLVISYAVCC